MNSITKKLTFSKSNRLKTPKDFKNVFQKPFRNTSACFSVLSQKTGKNIPRLGIIVAKRTIASAVKRNTIRRIVRESFRFHQYDLLGLDIVILIKETVRNRSIKEIRLCLEKHWKELASFAKEV